MAHLSVCGYNSCSGEPELSLHEQCEGPSACVCACVYVRGAGEGGRGALVACALEDYPIK